MKKYLISAILALNAVVAHAEFNRLIFRTLSGEEQSVGLTDLNITFTNGEMIATSKGQSVKLSLSALKSMEFFNDPADVESISLDKRLEGKISVFTPDGRFQGIYDSVADARNEMPKGIFILKAENGQTSKMLINR